MAGFFDYQGDLPGPGPVRRTLFARFHDGDWETLASFGAIRRYPAGATVFTADASEASLYFLGAGTVELLAAVPGAVTGGRTELGPGSVFGLLGFLDSRPRGISAVALTDIETIMLERAMFDRLSAWHPRIALVILQDVAEAVAVRLRQFDALL